MLWTIMAARRSQMLSRPFIVNICLDEQMQKRSPAGRDENQKWLYPINEGVETCGFVVDRRHWFF